MFATKPFKTRTVGELKSLLSSFSDELPVLLEEEIGSYSTPMFQFVIDDNKDSFIILSVKGIKL